VNVIALRKLREFWRKHPESETALRAWYKRLRKSKVENFNQLQEFFSTADYADPYTIFDVAGNNYRVIVLVVYRGNVAFIKRVFTHREYDDWDSRKEAS
jgi:mRNA interferase HigB